jgi:hypothetical protein
MTTKAITTKPMATQGVITSSQKVLNFMGFEFYGTSM